MQKVSMIIMLPAVAVVVLLLPIPVHAEIQVEVSGNGNNTANTVENSQSQDVSVTQNSQAQVENNIAQNAQTGNNTITDTNGSSQITSGNIDQKTTITNNANQNAANASCCQPANQETTVNNNGANSQNTVSNQSTQTTVVTGTQTTTITNTITGFANTGNNKANGNNGNVVIHTGNITSEITVVNIANRSNGSTSKQLDNIYTTISGNGTGSKNLVKNKTNSSSNVAINNNASIQNTITNFLNTGNNTASDNNGDVTILTGDIDSLVTITNGPINTTVVNDDCCKADPNDPQDPVGGTDPVLPPANSGGTSVNSSSSNGSGSGSSGGGSDEAVLGAFAQVLPATGANAIQFWMWAVMYLVMFLTGLYVRLRAGRSPNFATARTV